MEQNVLWLGHIFLLLYFIDKYEKSIKINEVYVANDVHDNGLGMGSLLTNNGDL